MLNIHINQYYCRQTARIKVYPVGNNSTEVDVNLAIISSLHAMESSYSPLSACLSYNPDFIKYWHPITLNQYMFSTALPTVSFQYSTLYVYG